MHAFQTTLLLWLQKIVLGAVSGTTVIFFARYVPWIFGLLLILIGFFETLRTVVTGTYHHFHKFFVGALGTFLVALVIQWLLKMIFSFGRPFTSGIPALYQYGGYDTFPSGHAVTLMALAVYMHHYHPWWGFFFVGLVILVGIARIIVGIHWPIDIIGGLIVGAIIGYGMIHITKML